MSATEQSLLEAVRELREQQAKLKEALVKISTALMNGYATRGEIAQAAHRVLGLLD